MLREVEDGDVTGLEEGVGEWEDEKRWKLIGESYINGVMNGEAMEWEDVKLEKLVLV